MKLFVWDFHGVLEKDNILAVIEITDRVLEEFGFPGRLARADYEKLYGQRWMDYFKKAVPEADEELIQAMTKRAFEISGNEKSFLKYIKQMDYAEEVLNAIRAKGSMNVVLSNSPPKFLLAFTESVKLTHLFDSRIGVDNHGTARFTPKADAIKRFCKGKKFDKVVVIGDHPDDIKAGHEVGATTYLFSQTGNFPDIYANHKITDLREVLKEL